MPITTRADSLRETPLPARAFRVLFAVVAVFGLPGFLCGCDAGSSAARPPSDRPIRLGYFANLTHAQAVLGVASGDFARAVQPRKLETRVFNAGPSLIEALFSGEIDIGYVGPSPTLNAHMRSGGAAVRVVAGAAANGVAIVASRNSGIRTLADLKGRLIATPQLGNTQDVSARHYLVHALGQSNADNIVPIANAEQLAMLQRGRIDAAWAPEPWAARLIAEAEGVLIAEEASLWADRRFTLTLVITTPEFLREQPETIAALLSAQRVWTRRLRDDPAGLADPLADALERLTGKRLPRATLLDALSRTLFTDEPLPESLQTFADWAYDLDFSPRKPDLAGLVDTTILRSLPD